MITQVRATSTMALSHYEGGVGLRSDHFQLVAKYNVERVTLKRVNSRKFEELGHGK